jgi:metal-responsive CopG/Arc/MetJ family transcriptional regulator
MKKTQITIRLPEMLLTEFDRYVDGLTFRNRAHGIEVILTKWLEFKRNEGKGEQQTLFKSKPLKKAGGKTK